MKSASKHKELFENTFVSDPKMTSVKKFYFLEYYYILLKSVEQSSIKSQIFENFRNRKDSFQLGESRYKKLIVANDSEPSNKKLGRYEYTFKEVIEESEQYGLLKRKGEEYLITPEGLELVKKFDSQLDQYYLSLLNLIESHSSGFKYLIEKCYENHRNGVLIFPIYSPPKLNMQKSEIKHSADIITYIDLLTVKLSEDISEHIGKEQDLGKAKENLISRLISSNLIADEHSSNSQVQNYYGILKRIRDYWLSYFLNEVYKIPISLSYFDIWCYRGRQLDILNVTEFYYSFSGKIVYPVSILHKGTVNEDFKSVYSYPDGKSLLLHSPGFISIQEQFIKVVYESYIDLKGKYKTYFINLADLRDVVCFKLRIPYSKFAMYLDQLYQMNLKNEIKIKISLEADKLPSETQAMYLKREPIIIENKARNIIAIDIKK